jgi:hypothetical protein
MVASFYDSAADVLVCKVHKMNSLEHLKANRFGPRPTSAASSRFSGYSTGASSVSMQQRRPRPQSAMPRMQGASSVASTVASSKTVMQKKIDGDEGPAMIGVSTYPYTRPQKQYLDDFQSVVATTIDHPYMATTAFNRASVPHDLLYGSNFDDDRLGGRERKWRSEYSISYAPKSYVDSKRALCSGVRSEQFQFLG